MTICVTRFAPSPTGPLHLGHAYAAILAHDMAHAQGGTFLLRIEDIDQSRARPEWETQIEADLHWLGLNWSDPIMRQSDRLPIYRRALQRLWTQGLLYPCICNRRDILEAASAPQEGAPPAVGPDGVVYPGTCRHLPEAGLPLPQAALRLNMRRALDLLGAPQLTFVETGSGPLGETGTITVSPDDLCNGVGDIVLARRDMGTSYHLSVVLDDAAQGVTHVTRGRDLFEATQIHILLQRLLALPTPLYHHHRLIRDEHGKRLAKRDDASAIAKYRSEGATSQDIRQMIGLS
ncbi:tRNA glutamyl-Q(34) synthetase GluQRS [Thalassovita taeanensis]|uniref:Glutamyl-Q tRNA(Asp) synthetase n=1 Tax=Thalassovita taeanensis TaxID=657014 RepID=A0A1H8Z9F9_9RHOB|nr:tRNA glutamyl-Q(34) synthetase GluQRS [Thalassovita taeanensis]SEP61065.1 glutamyl-Q tRNA(Asp) synthetase [Thalassovita taeanensis]